jgi:hypothetical protein
MSTEPWGQFDYYFAGSGNQVEFEYEVVVETATECAEEATVSQAQVYYSTPPVSPWGQADEAHDLKKKGTGTFDLDLSTYEPPRHSPLLVQFVFSKDFTAGSKSGTSEGGAIPTPYGLVLAEPEVGSIGVQVQGKVEDAIDAKVGEALTLEVGEWGVLLFETPGGPPRFEGGLLPSTSDVERFPSGFDADIHWVQGGAELAQGATASLTPADADLGKELTVTAYRREEWGIGPGWGEHASATIAVPRLELVGLDAKGAEVTAPDKVGIEAATRFRAKLTPQLEGTFAWTSTTDKLAIGDGKSSSASVDGLEVHVQGTASSASDGDQTLKLTWTSKKTGKVYEVEQKLTVSKWPGTIKGKPFFKRTWDYEDETTPIAAVNEVLPFAKVELWVQKKGAAKSVKHAAGALTEEGTFTFKDVPEPTKLELKVFLEHDGGKVVQLLGNSNAAADADFEVKKDQVIWHLLPLDATKVGDDLDFKEVEITKALFTDLCDLYRTVWLGHDQLKTLTGEDAPLCPTYYPQDPSAGTTHHAGGKLYVLAVDLKDRCVLLHEYGHFIDGKVGPNPTNPGYEFDDDVKKKHFRDSEEHDTAAWKEGLATFLSAALNGSPHYHDGWEPHPLDYHLDTDSSMKGFHSEGSIQEALWAFHKTHGADLKDIFKAWKDTSKRKVDSAYAFYLNYKDSGLAKLDKLVEAYKSRNLEFHYQYRDGWECVAAGTGDATKKTFETLDDLHTALGGAGTLEEYKREFYNRNKYISGGGALAAGSTKADPKVTVGVKYLAPERVQVTT